MGSGQGLTLAYYLVHDRHGGTISFTCDSGAGTTFVVRLPSAAVDGEQHESGT